MPTEGRERGSIFIIDRRVSQSALSKTVELFFI